MNSFETVAAAFGLPYDPKDQDWELGAADSRRISEFMDGYPLLPDSASRQTLVGVLLASFEEAQLEGAVDEREWRRFWELIGGEPESFGFDLAYWSQIPTIGESVNAEFTALGYSVDAANYALVRLST